MKKSTKVDEAVAILRQGGVVVYPTETVYGIGCDPLNRAACERIQAMKDRISSKPLLLLAASVEQVVAFAGELNETAQRLASIFWPGPLTIVMKPALEVPAHLLGGSGGVAFRVTSHPVAAALAEGLGRPIVSTSANVAGNTPLTTFEEAEQQFGADADLILQNTEPLHGKPSTVVDVTGRHLAIIREGAISQERIKELL